MSYKPIHIVKLDIIDYKDVESGQKQFHIIFGEHKYDKIQVGHLLQMKEFHVEQREYTGNRLLREIKFIQHGSGFGLGEGYLCVGF